MTLPEYEARWTALIEVWQALHRATDTPESAAAVRALAAAVRALGRYARMRASSVSADRGDAEGAAYGLFDELRAAGILRADEDAGLRELGPLNRQLSRFAEYSEAQDRANVLLVSRCLPALWRALNALQDELRAQRPRAFYVRRAKTMVRVGLMLVAAWILLASAWIAYGLLQPAGWRVTYYYGIGLKRPLAVRGEQTLERNYGTRAPAFPIRRDRWSARWEGRLRISETGRYTFVVQADDGYRLYLNQTLLLDAWRDQSWRSSMGKVRVDLAPGEYPIRVEHYDHAGDAAIRVRWSGGSIPRDTPLGAPDIVKP